MRLVKIDQVDERHAICVIVAIFLVVVFACFSFDLAARMEGTSGYVADETWYVISSRNILREIFGVQPGYVDPMGRYNYTVFFKSFSALKEDNERFRDFIRTRFNGVVTKDYEKVPAISVATAEELDRNIIFEAFPQVKLIQSGYWYPDVSGADTYMNAEHPPLVKYLIGISMLLLGDQPMAWRIPGIVAGALALLVTYFFTARLLGNGVAALLVFPLALTDPILRAMSSVAMLDIYVAFFLSLSLWFALRRGYLLSAVFIGLASTSKFTGLFSVAALFLLMVLRKSSVKKTILYPFVVPLLIWFGFNIPLVIKWGVQGWIREIQIGLHWFLTSRPPGPAVSDPWGWFVNQSPFTLNLNPDVAASVNPAVYLLAIVSLFLTPYIAYKLNRDSIIPALWFLLTFLGYVAVYLLGNRTMYSFYVVTLSVMAYALATVFLFYLLTFLESCSK
ncbi:MAG: glycosyltransferase family 39 protein [Candidatus Hadarchaeum sp.]|uniref:glycosyltransferase family 39 protein n=1 Tax=Candidatus Hadarchaeum sp. TaxID=2883567 RepID=UPI0031817E9C